MTTPDETAHIFVGADRSQLLAVKVLEHSIRRHTALAVQIRSMHDLDLPDPNDPRQGKRTGFSFSRFAIPALMGYAGSAVYLDADMLVLRDFRELWSLPFQGCKVIIQESVPLTEQHAVSKGAPRQRLKQCSVMLLDCAALDWKPETIIAGLDGSYTYEDLLYHMCILREEEIRYAVPFQWNSLEVYEPGKTGLIHYTDMNTQPWVHPGNANGWLWLEELRLMLGNGSLTLEEIGQEVEAGYFRPSLLAEINEIGDGPARPVTEAEVRRYKQIDDAAGFQQHRAVHEAARRRKLAILDYEAKLAREAGVAAQTSHLAGSMLREGRTGWRRVAGALRRRLLR